MSSTVSDNQEKYISINKALSILHVSSERITWFIGIKALSSIVNPQDRSRKLVSLQDVHRLRNTSPQLLAPWLIYVLVDPRNNAIRYVGRTNEPQRRFRQHLNSPYVENPAKYLWLQDLKKHDLLPRIEILEGVNGTLKDVGIRETVWIEHFKSIGTELLNLPDITQKNRDIYRNVDRDYSDRERLSEEWVTIQEAVRRLKVGRNKISRLAGRGQIQTKDNPLDARVTLVNLEELRAIFEQYGPHMGDDKDDDDEI